MKLENSIGWCDVTSNAVIGCSRVSHGCRECYAFRDTPARVLRSKGIETWGPQGVRHPVAGFAAKVRHLNKLCICDECHQTDVVESLGKNCRCIINTTKYSSVSCDAVCGGKLRRIRCFADSNSDWLDGGWPIETLAAFLKVIYDTPNVDFLLLTKRPKNFEARMYAVAIKEYTVDNVFLHWINNWRGVDAPKNVWLGVSCENQEWADKRVPELLKIPAKVKFVSAEPILGPVDFAQIAGGLDLDWVIVGGESGPNHRPCEVQWITDIADQCKAAGVPVWVKQDSAVKPGQQGRIPDVYWALKQTPKL